jgi:hypothetical protein
MGSFINGTVTPVTAAISVVAVNGVDLSINTLPVVASAMSMVTPTVASVYGALTVPSAAIAVTFGVLASVSGTVTTPRSALTGRSTIVATIAATIVTPTFSAGGYSAVLATVAAKLAKPQTYISVRSPAAQVLVAVTNMRTKAVTEYSAYPFNSFAEIDGKYYAAGDGGFYQIENPAVRGDFDGTNTNAISGKFRFGQNDFGAEVQKRASDCYAGMRAEGDMTVRVYVDERAAEEYTLSPTATTLKQVRVPIGKGLKGKYWQLEVENTNGNDFDFDTINIAAVPLSRRI